MDVVHHRAVHVSATALFIAVLVIAAVLLAVPTSGVRDRRLRRRLGALSSRAVGRADAAEEGNALVHADERMVPVVLVALRRPGRWVRGSLRLDSEPRADLAGGVVAVLILPVWLAVGPVPALLLAGSVIAAGEWAARRVPARHEEAVRAVLPDVVDLFRLAVGAGMSVHQSIDVVAARAAEPAGSALREVCRRVTLGVRLGDALGALDRLGEPGRPLAAALTASARYGAPLTAALERVVVDSRVLRRRRAEERARKLPVKLLFPLVFCVLPAFGLLAVVPLLAGALPSLSSTG